MKGVTLAPSEIAVGKAQFGVLVDWLYELWRHKNAMREMSKDEINSTLFDEVGKLRDRIEELERENASLAAGQCVHGAPTAGGDFRCCCQTDAGALGELMTRLVKTGDWWWLGKGTSNPGEPLWGCVILEPEIGGSIIAQAEGHSLPTSIERALAEHGAHVERMSKLNAKKDAAEGIR